MSSSAAREEWRTRRTQIVLNWAEKNSLEIVQLNQGYQLRIENVLDIYPTNGRWHIMATGERGDWHLKTHDLNELYATAVRRSGQTFDMAKGEQPIHGIELTGVNKVTVHDIDVPETDTYRLHKIRAEQGDGDSAALVAQIEATHRKQSRKWWQFWRRK